MQKIKNKNILITGGAGFIGSKLSLKLVEHGYKVTVLDTLSEQVHGKDPEANSPLYNSIKNKVHFIQGSVTDRDELELSLIGQNIIVHLAAETGTGQSMYDIEKYTATNVMGSALLLDILTNQKHEVKKIVLASSRAIYGEGKYYSNKHGNVYPDGRDVNDLKDESFDIKGNEPDETLSLMPTDEESRIHPSSVYGITKQVQEQLVMLISKSIGINGTSLRFQNVYGPGQSLSNPYTGILSIFSTRIMNGNDINIFEDGNESRDFIYVDDVVDSIILAIEKDEANGQIFNVGTGIPVSVYHVAKLLVKSFNRDVPINISGQFRVGDIRHNYADISKITSLLGFNPKVQIEEGIERFVSWVKNQPVNQDGYDKSISLLLEKGLFKK